MELSDLAYAKRRIYILIPSSPAFWSWVWGFSFSCRAMEYQRGLLVSWEILLTIPATRSSTVGWWRRRFGAFYIVSVDPISARTWEAFTERWRLYTYLHDTETRLWTIWWTRLVVATLVASTHQNRLVNRGGIRKDGLKLEDALFLSAMAAHYIWGPWWLDWMQLAGRVCV